MTLIDTVVGSALLLLVFVGVAGVFQLSVDVVTNNKARAGAIALANERMEYIRGLDYSQVGTVGGIPSGPVVQDEIVTLNGFSYARRTYIEYGDDPYDGLGSSDIYPAGSPISLDYKAVRVDVSWSSRIGQRHITLLTRVEPLDGKEIACSSPCGAIAITVTNAADQPVSNARVRIVNTSTNPAIDLTTYTNTSGVVDLLGAPVASGYQVSVSKTGHNSAQTYSSDAQNLNPTPGHLTVSQNQTASVAFGIDALATKTVYTYTAIAPAAWTDDLADAGLIASSTNIAHVSGAARLSGSAGSYPEYGALESVAIGPSHLVRWKTLSWSGSTPAGTSVRFYIYDGSGTTLLPDSIVPGNGSGLTDSSIDLWGVSSSTYSSIRVQAVLTSTDPNATPTIDSYSISHDAGPEPLAGVPFTMVLDKRIGSGPPVIYKYEAELETGAEGGLTLANLEWGDYTVSFPGLSSYVLAYSCAVQPEYLAPDTVAGANFYFAPAASNALALDVRASGAALANATTALVRAGFSATSTTDSCGQTYFNNLASGTYTLSVSAPGFQPYNNPSVSVSGVTRLQISLNP